MEQKIEIIRQLADKYNKEEYFTGDPIIFPKHFAKLMQGEEGLPGMGGFPAGESIITVSYDVEAKLVSRPHGMLAARRGSLLFSLPVEIESKMVEYTKAGVQRKFPYCDYEFFPTEDWGYAFAGEDGEAIENGISDYPFSREHPPVQ
ncbi:MAG: hypothetical protein J6U83_07545, partial [Bacteroidales bacterium]|nr:hypothetical protein [Bacteroidales bacterium]